MSLSIYFTNKMSEYYIVVKPSKIKNKKYTAIINDKYHVNFGQKGALDYTQHKDPKRKERYIRRHEKNEDWDLSGIKTAGFFAKHLLWNKPTLQESADDIERIFNVIVELDI